MRKYLLPLAFTLFSTLCFSQNDSLSELLEVVIIDHKTDKEIIEQSGFAVNVIQTREAGLRNLQTNELLDRTVGVRIRQNGGLVQT